MHAVFRKQSCFKSKQYPLYHVGCEGTDISMPVVGVVGVCVLLVAVAIVIIVLKNKKQHQPDAVQQPVVQQPVKQQTPAASNPDDSGYRVQCTSGALAGQRFMIRKYTDDFRRNNELCNVIFPETPGVSGKHCAVWYKHGKIFYKIWVLNMVLIFCPELVCSPISRLRLR